MIRKPGIQEKSKMKLEHEELNEKIIGTATRGSSTTGTVNFLVSWFPDKKEGKKYA